MQWDSTLRFRSVGGGEAERIARLSLLPGGGGPGISAEMVIKAREAQRPTMVLVRLDGPCGRS